MDINEILDRAKKAGPRTRTVEVPVDPNVAEDIASIERRLAKARTAPVQGSIDEPSEVDALQAELDEAWADAEGAIARFTLKELTRPDFRTLVASYPSDDPKAEWDDETFEPALLAACSVDPEMTVGQAMELRATLGNSAMFGLVQAALALQAVPARIPFGVRNSGSIADLPPSSESVPDSGSLTATS